MKKNSITVISILFIGFVLISCPFIEFEPIEGAYGSLEYLEYYREITIIGYSGSETVFSIPSEIIGKAVTTIGKKAFYGSGTLVEIIIPDTVKTIESFAFSSCSNLTELIIPRYVNSISRSAFKACGKLEDIHIAEKNKTFSDIDGVLFTDDGTELYIYSEGRTESSYMLPEGTVRLEARVFADNDTLVNIQIPKSLKNTGYVGFVLCSKLESISVHAENSIFASDDGILYIKDFKTLLTYPSNKPGSRYSIPEHVETVAVAAFAYSHNLIEIFVPKTLIIMGDFAFENSPHLTDVYCEAAAEPSAWGAFWYNNCYAVVHWGADGFGI
jgi:hypothetical protein